VRCLEPIIETLSATEDQRRAHNSLVSFTEQILNEHPV
jgi:hypothetical protein